MSEIKEFMTLFLSVLVVSGIVISLSPEGNLKRYIRYICMLCLTASLCVPILSTLSSIPGRITDMSEKYGEVSGEESRIGAEELMIAETKKQIEESLLAYVCDKYGLSREKTAVEIFLQTDDIESIEITEVTVTLADASRAEAIRADLYEMFLRKTLITVRKG